jgi:hypothetical protein
MRRSVSRGCVRCWCVLLVAALVWMGNHAPAAGQASIGVQEFSPFVLALIPVVRNGAVGGISVDAQGMLRAAEPGDIERLREAWRQALPGVDGPVATASPLRKISLRRLERALGERHRQGNEPDQAMQFLAGLQRVRYVFVYPDSSDIVLAGPAEGWRLGESGDVLGIESGRPVLRLADLLTAWRAIAAAAEDGQAITCSIDPAPEGLVRIQELTAGGGLTAGQATLAELERQLGPQDITVTGVAPESHFARLMVAADFRMKRLAMGFERPPISGLPGYLQLVKSARGAPPTDLLPRWWLAPRYDALGRDADGLAWELRGPGVQCLTEDSRLAADGQVEGTGAAGASARQWAQNMTDRYEALSERLPVFAELRNAMDLAVVAALMVRHDLPGKSGWSFPQLAEGGQHGPEFAAPRQIDSRASFVRRGKHWIVSISGGVEIDPWAVMERTEESAETAAARAAAEPAEKSNWWWD